MKNIYPLFLLLTACTQSPAIQAVEVKLPVSVACGVEIAKEPDWNLPKVGKFAKPSEKLQAALVDLELSKGYIEELKAELEVCN